jgi:hypothetical protein
MALKGREPVRSKIVINYRKINSFKYLGNWYVMKKK